MSPRNRCLAGSTWNPVIAGSPVITTPSSNWKGTLSEPEYAIATTKTRSSAARRGCMASPAGTRARASAPGFHVVGTGIGPTTLHDVPTPDRGGLGDVSRAPSRRASTRRGAGCQNAGRNVIRPHAAGHPRPRSVDLRGGVQRFRPRRVRARVRQRLRRRVRRWVVHHRERARPAGAHVGGRALGARRRRAGGHLLAPAHLALAHGGRRGLRRP